MYRATLILIALLCLILAPGNAIHAQAACGSQRTTNDSEEATLISLINQERAGVGLPALTSTPALTEAAATKAANMAASGVFAHDSAQATEARDESCGNNANGGFGENIAAGNVTGAATFQQFKNSPEHDANQTASAFKAIGVARTYGRFNVGAQEYSGEVWAVEFSTVVDGVVSPVIPTPTPPQPTPQPMNPCALNWVVYAPGFCISTNNTVRAFIGPLSAGYLSRLAAVRNPDAYFLCILARAPAC